MSEHLHRKLAAIHESLLHGKLPRNLHWTDALELIGHLGQVKEQGGDEFEFIVGRSAMYSNAPTLLSSESKTRPDSAGSSNRLRLNRHRVSPGSHTD